MNDGYVFWCTPCKTRHAGECEVVLKKSPAKHAWDLIDINAPIIIKLPPFKMLPVTFHINRSATTTPYPSVGSKWNMEDFINGSWFPRAASLPGLYYVIKSVSNKLSGGVVITVNTVIPNGAPYDQLIDPDAFTDAGHDTGIGRYRMVPMP